MNGRILRSLQESELFYERLSADENGELLIDEATHPNNKNKLPKVIIPEVIVSNCKSVGLA